MPRQFTIYALASPRGDIRYVGITSLSTRQRLYNHQWSAEHDSRYPVHAWMRKLKRFGSIPETHVLEQTADALRESVWIQFFISRGYPLLNCTKGGEGYFERSDAARAAQSAASKGRTVSRETRDLMSRNRRGRKMPPRSEEHRRKLAESNRQRKWTADQHANYTAARKGKSAGAQQRAHLADLATAQKGRKHRPESLAKMRLVQKKSPDRCKLTPEAASEIRRRYTLGGITQAALGREYGVCRRLIGMVIAGQRWEDAAGSHTVATPG